MPTSNLVLSPLMSKANEMLRRNHIFLSRKKGLTSRDRAWNEGLSAEWHGRKLIGKKSHPVSITFTHKEGAAVVDVYDLQDGVTILTCSSI